MRGRHAKSSPSPCGLRLADGPNVHARELCPESQALHRLLPCKTVFAIFGRRTYVTHAHTGPLCSSPATLASVGTISYTKARVVRAGPLTGSCEARLEVGLEGEEEGERAGYGGHRSEVVGRLRRVERRAFGSKQRLRSPAMRRWCPVSRLVGRR